MKKLIYDTTIPLLNNEYKVVVCWGTLSQLKKILLDHHYDEEDVTIKELKKDIGGHRGVTFSQNTCYSVIWLDGNLPCNELLGTLAHEAVHVVNRLFDFIGEKGICDEIFAHSVGAIVRESLKAMDITWKKESK